MNLKIIFFIVAAFHFNTAFAQFEIELDEVYNGMIKIDDDLMVNNLSMHLSFEANKIIEKFSNDFGNYETLKEKDNTKLYKWDNVIHKSWSNKPISIYIETSYLRNLINKANETEVIQTNPIVLCYILDKKNKDFLKSSRKQSKLREYFKNIIKSIK
ncbi:hypothetical protein [Psychroserpens sp. Hel_I_66]|uniref:hypothetical protein n=1 Tax=Psychroserpens sp. Hel_I_66 TaxID=1250004 RepID=UPI000645EA23|nr:hypothetical protein [Psychroserpens sp. Hel_I_66]